MGLSIDKIRQHKMKDLTLGNGASAVMLPLIPDESDATGYSVLFQVRSESIVQGGEICFPGGMIEPGESGSEAAVRETCEELLVDPEQVELLAPLVTQRGPRNRLVKSYIGILHDYEGTYSSDEVGRMFTIPLSELLEMEPVEGHVAIRYEAGDDFPYELLPGGRDYKFADHGASFYFYETEEGVIWGITAEVLKAFLEL